MEIWGRSICSRFPALVGRKDSPLDLEILLGCTPFGLEAEDSHSAVTMEDHDTFTALAGSVLTGKEPGQPIQDSKPHLDLPDGETKKKQGSNQSKTEGVGQDVESKAEIKETPEGHGDDMSLEKNQDDSERKAGSHSINDIEVAIKSADLKINISASFRILDSD